MAVLINDISEEYNYNSETSVRSIGSRRISVNDQEIVQHVDQEVRNSPVNKINFDLLKVNFLRLTSRNVKCLRTRVTVICRHFTIKSLR